MSESEKTENEDGGIPIIESSDPCKEKRRAGFAFLFVAFALILGASTPERAGSGSAFWEGLCLFGFLLAGAGVCLVKTPWSVSIALAVFAALNGFTIGANGWHVSLLLLAGGVAAWLALRRGPAIKQPVLRAFEFAVGGFFAQDQEDERELARALAREFAPIIALVLCVVAVFGFLGLIGEILTVGILAVFAWLGKMEKHYGAPDYISIGGIIKDPLTGKHIGVDARPLFTLKAFAPKRRKKKQNPKINIGLAWNAFGPLYFCVGYDSIYKFWEFARMVRETGKIMEEELKSRNATGGIWHISWQGVVTSKRELSFAAHSMRGVHPDIFLALVNLYFWHLIRYGCPFLPRVVRPIGQNAARIFYFFYRSDTVARETTRMRGFWIHPPD